MTLLEHLNAVSIERGFRDFRHLTDDGLVYVVEDIIEVAGKRYAEECVKASLSAAANGMKLKRVNYTNMTTEIFNSVSQDGITIYGHISSITDPKNIILL